MSPPSLLTKRGNGAGSIGHSAVSDANGFDAGRFENGSAAQAKAGALLLWLKPASMIPELLGASLDSKYVHLAWKKSDPKLQTISFPLLADNKRELSETLGILHPRAKIPLLATTINVECERNLS